MLSIDQFSFVRDKVVRTVLTEWFALYDGTHVPERNQIDPVRLPKALPYLYILEYEEDVGRFFIRLSGETIRDVYDRPITGKYLDELNPDAVNQRVNPYYLATIDVPCIVHISGRLYAEAQRPAIGERLLMPITHDSVNVNGILGVTHFKWWSPKNAEPPPRHQERLFTPLDGSESHRHVLSIEGQRIFDRSVMS